MCKQKIYGSRLTWINVRSYLILNILGTTNKLHEVLLQSSKQRMRGCVWMATFIVFSLTKPALAKPRDGGGGNGRRGGEGASLVITDISGEVVGTTITAFSASSVFSILAFSFCTRKEIFCIHPFFPVSLKRLGHEMNIFLGIMLSVLSLIAHQVSFTFILPC
jgi:hypothetical protein